MVALRPETVLRDNPVVRPLFFTAWLTDATTVELETVPISRIAPLEFTIPEITFPTEQSTLLPGKECFTTNVATLCALLMTARQTTRRKKTRHSVTDELSVL